MKNTEGWGIVIHQSRSKRWGLLILGACISACGVDDFEPPLHQNGPGLPDDAVVVDGSGGASKGTRPVRSPGLRSNTGVGGRLEPGTKGIAGEGSAGENADPGVGGTGGTTDPSGTGGEPLGRCVGRPDPKGASGGSAGKSSGGGGAAGTGSGGVSSAGNGAAGNGGDDAGTGGTPGSDAGSSGHGGVGAASGDGGSGGAPASERSLFFSEYVEGSGKTKALEIYAFQSSSLEGCVVSTYFNGKTVASSRTKLHGELRAGDIWVLCSSDLQKRHSQGCDQSAGLTFNGDDAIALECDGQTIDVIGQMGVDPGEAWEDASTSTTACTLRRSCNVAAGDSDGLDTFSASVEWVGYPLDVIDDLGMHACTPP